MSYNETKTVLRAELPELRGKTYQEVYPYYLKVIGEPDDLSVYEGEVNFFAYEGEFQEAIDHKNKRWGIDWVLHHHTDYRTEMEMESNGITLKGLQVMLYVMAYKFKVDKSKIRLLTTTWYNGSDEPVNLGED